MKELNLSELSRGCGQIFPCEGQQNGRLDVCFTPEDYFIWKAHGPLLHLSNGSVVAGPGTSLPKTFSTRRGALLLYSQGLASWKKCPSNNYYEQCSTEVVQQGAQQPTAQHITKEPALKNIVNLEANGRLSISLPTLDRPQRPDVGNQEDNHHHERGRRILGVHFPSITTDSSPLSLHHRDMAPAASHYTMRGSVERSGKVKEADSKHKSDKTSTSHPNQSDLIGAEIKLIGESKVRAGKCLPPLKAGASLCREPYQLLKNKDFKGELPDRLPPVDDGEAWGHKPQDKNPERLPQQRLLPHLATEKSEEEHFQKKGKEMSASENKHEKWSQKVREGHCVDHLNMSLGTEARNAPFGKRGPGRQRVSEGPSDSTHRQVVRGLLPLELRDLNGQAVGSLILGPDGEIIQLSMFDHVRDSCRGRALEVVSAQGEKLPWVLVLQDEGQLTDENKEKDVPRFVIQTEHFYGQPREANGVQTEGADVNTGDSSVKASVKNPDGKAESVVPEPVHLDGTEGKGSRDEPRMDDTKKKGRSTHLQQRLEKNEESASAIGPKSEESASAIGPKSEESASAIGPKNEESASAIGPKNEESASAMGPKNEAMSQNTTKNTEDDKITSFEEKSVENKEKITEARSNQQEKVWGEKKKKLRKNEQNHIQDTTMAENSSKRAPGEEATAKDVKKRRDRKGLSGGLTEEASGERGQKRSKAKARHNIIKAEEAPDEGASPAVNSGQDIKEELSKHRRDSLSDKNSPGSEAVDARDGSDRFPANEPGLDSGARGQSVRSLRSSGGGLAPKPGASLKPTSSSRSRLSRSRLSSCSTVMIPEEGLMLNPNKAEIAMTEQVGVTQEDKAAAVGAKRAIKENEEERKRREEEEEQKRQQQKAELEQKMKNELQSERQRRAEEIRLKKQAEEEETRRREEEDKIREQRQREKYEREIRVRQERKRQMEHFQRRREEEDERRKAEMKQMQMLEEERLQEEKLKLQGMSESERAEYLRKKQEEEDVRQREEDERRLKEEEAALLAAEKESVEEELLAREMALLHQRLSFKRGLMVESEGLEQSQSISRPWTYSYFTLLQMLGLSSAGVPRT